MRGRRVNYRYSPALWDKRLRAWDVNGARSLSRAGGRGGPNNSFLDTPDRPPKFVQVKHKEAHVLVRSDGDEIVIESLTATMLKCITEVRFPLHGNPAHLPDVFDGVAHFNYFLERKNVADPLHGFALEMHQLRGNYPMHEPDPSVGKNGNMVVDGAVRFVSDANAIYGFTIRNTSPEELFPYLFYFDPEEYTIDVRSVDWYTPENRNAAPLDANDGKVTLGMGGEKAFEFSLPPGKRESSGFLKLFVTREFIDLGWIEQGLSPFDSKFEGTGRLKVQREKLDCISTWDALTVTLTMLYSNVTLSSLRNHRPSWYTPENWNAPPLGMGGEKVFEFAFPPDKRESCGFQAIRDAGICRPQVDPAAAVAI
ncbi:hypothetical protein B0H19DRAFT_1370207 [Mycena capillaripes]|nr:hypothetical protein B0H19DRAFT_1370207 [Mycena capillaripes]